MLACVHIETILRPLVEDRIYPDMVREGQDATLPYIIYQEISCQPETTLEGVTGHEWVHLQIDVYHSDKLASTYLSHKVICTINDHIKPSVYGGKQTLPDGDTYRTIIDYEFWQTADTE